MKTLVVIALAVVAGACASYSGYGLRAGASTGAEVRQTMGAPAQEFSNSDGSRELIYPHGPMGTETFVAHLDAHGVLTGIEQVLDDDHLHRIETGATREQVLRRIGPPGTTMDFPRLHEIAWGYRYVDSWGYLCEFSVTFDAQGRVASTFSRRLDGRSKRD